MFKRDHELLVDSTTQSFTLIRDENNKAMYQVIEEIPRYQNPLLFTQRDWSGGHGQYDFIAEDMFFEGQAIDTTQDGRLILGPEKTEVKESDDTDLDSAPVKFLWFAAAGELLCATSGKIYRYIKSDTGIDTDEALDASETGVDCDADATSAIPIGSIIEIENEIMEVTATGSSLTVIRGIRGTTAATHVTNTDIFIRKWTAATTTVAGVTDMVEYEAIAYAAVGASTKYYYSADGITWTQTDLTDGFANYFQVAPNLAGTQDVLWKAKTPNEVSNTTDGRTVAAGGVQWSSATYVGDSSSDITNLFLHQDRLFAGRVDGLWELDSDGGIHALRPDLLQNRSTDNFKYMASWAAGTYFSEIDGMGEITGRDAYDQMGPLTKVRDRTPGDIGKRGSIVGIASDKDWLYIAIDEGTNTHIYKGRERRKGALVWEWCPWIFLGTKTCATIATVQHSTTDRRLWFGFTNTTGYAILSDNPTSDSAARFDTSDENWVRMSYTYGTNPYWDKLWQSIVTQTKGCAAGITVTPKYRKDTDTSATALTAAITTNGTVNTNLSSALSGNRIQFELHLTTNDNTKTPEVLFFEARGIEKPETIKIHECTYLVGDDLSNRAETLRSLLRDARTSTSLVKFADLRYGDSTSGTDYVWVILQPGYPQEVEVLATQKKQPVLGIKCRFQEVSFTIS